MRKQVRLVVAAGILALGPQPLVASDPQPNLKRPVDAPNVGAEISLGELASQANRDRNITGEAKHVYTNADLKLRPAPVPPTTPPFPEIAPATGILEHAGPPEVDQIEFAPVPQGVPMWDLSPGVGLVVPAPGRVRQRNRSRLSRPDDPFNRLGLFEPGFGLRSGSLPAPLGSGKDLFTVGRGGRSFNGFSSRDRASAQGHHQSSTSSRSQSRGSAPASPVTRSSPASAGKPQQ